MRKRIYGASTVIVLALLSFSCGIKTGSATYSDRVPSGTLIYQGTLSASNATGAVQIYNSSGEIVVRFQGLSLDSASYYFFLASTTNPTAYVHKFKGMSGDQNYSTGIAPGPVWASVTIRTTNSVISATLTTAALLSVP